MRVRFRRDPTTHCAAQTQEDDNILYVAHDLCTCGHELASFSELFYHLDTRQGLSEPGLKELNTKKSVELTVSPTLALLCC